MTNDPLHVALKEWAAVCSALEAGRQILLLRKGGIHEESGRFELEHPRFALFPTYLHQQAGMLKPEAHFGLQPLPSEPPLIPLRSAGVVHEIVRVASRARIDALDDQHIWTPPLIDMRFNYRPENPLYLLLVRVYLLAEPVTVENTPAYAGCKSWVPLTQNLCAAGWKPVLDDEAFAEKVRTIQQRMTS